MKFNQMRIIMLGTAAALSPVVLLAQASPGSMPSSSAPQDNRQMQQQPGSPATQDSSNNAGEMGQGMRDKMFLHQAAEGGMAEVQFGQLATQKASSGDVKAFGQKMVDDHTALNNMMAPIAGSMGVKPPKSLNKKNQAEYDKLNGLSGNDFDTEYLTVMVKDHHKDLRDFHDEAGIATDPTLKAAVQKGETVIAQHTAMVDQIAQNKGIAIPGKK
jgi:putative membrane protein